MKKLARVLCAAMAASMVLTGCGNSACEDFVDAFVELGEKGAACGDDYSSGITDANRDESVEQCEAEETFENCSSDDQAAIRDFAECVSDMPTCTTANEENFQVAFSGCIFTLASDVSDECFSTSGESIRRKVARMTTSHY
ncbi:hypothetical protein JQX13_01550 [Archangium violaceum]|uniref:hypothetical protein n=1 Tax=Archangium violaceum TaxID=83451 RepID=UPI00193C4B6B|nr:hypothetical protein [Archangium violaceum]QRK08885.1 hypothetical protein JQX13_01550 [Archangium violaceum]